MKSQICLHQNLMESSSVQFDYCVETILQCRDLAAERLLEENRQRFTPAGTQIISVYKQLFNRSLRRCRGHLENLVPQMSEFQA